MAEYCKRCGRKLKDRDSVIMGMGPTCYQKHIIYTERFLISLFPEKKEGKKK